MRFNTVRFQTAWLRLSESYVVIPDDRRRTRVAAPTPQNVDQSADDLAVGRLRTTDATMVLDVVLYHEQLWSLNNRHSEAAVARCNSNRIQSEESSTHGATARLLLSYRPAPPGPRAGDSDHATARLLLSSRQAPGHGRTAWWQRA